jgi:hypothetical protein
MESTNPIVDMLNAMPVWQEMGITLQHSAEHVHFTRGNITLTIPYIEVLIFGTKTVYTMFRVLDQ